MGVEQRGSRKMGFDLGEYKEEVVTVGSTQCALPSIGISLRPILENSNYSAD